MKQVTIEKSKRYKYCNYCRRFIGDSNSSNTGMCFNPEEFSVFPYSSRAFFHPACKFFIPSIHNAYNLESPEYAEDFMHAFICRTFIKQDAYLYKDTNFTVKLSKRWSKKSKRK